MPMIWNVEEGCSAFEPTGLFSDSLLFSGRAPAAPGLLPAITTEGSVAGGFSGSGDGRIWLKFAESATNDAARFAETLFRGATDGTAVPVQVCTDPACIAGASFVL